MEPEAPILVAAPRSHAGRTARWGLAQARIDHRLLEVPPRRMRDAAALNPLDGTLPVLCTGEERTCGSHAILEWAHEHRDEAAPPLYPRRLAGAVRAWQRWADDVVAPVVGRETTRQLVADPTPLARDRHELRVLRRGRRSFEDALERQRAHRFEDADPGLVAAFIPRIAGRLKATGTGFLFDDQPTAADVATAAVLAPLVPIAHARGHARHPGWGQVVRLVEAVRPETPTCLQTRTARRRDLRRLGGAGRPAPTPTEARPVRG